MKRCGGVVQAVVADPEEYLMAMSELQVWREGKNLAAGRPVECSSSSTEPGWTPTALTDGYSSREQLLDWPAWLTGIERAEALRAGAATR